MKLLIVGGVAGGAAAAARARRLNEKAEIIMFERGEHISFANCGLPYYAGDIIKDKQKLLLQTPKDFMKRFRVDVRIRSLVTAVDRENKLVVVKNLSIGEEYRETYDKLILSPGAEPFVPNIPGAASALVHKVRTIPDIDRIKGMIDSGSVKKAVIIGGGFIGIEMAENLRHRDIDVTLIEKLDQVLPQFDKDMAVILHRELIAMGVALKLESEVVSIGPKGDAKLNSGELIAADMVIMCIGVRPETELAKAAGLAIGRRGIKIDEHMRTSDENIYAVGDAVEVKNPITGKDTYVPLAWPASRGAVAAANNIFGINDVYKGTIGTSVIKVFKFTAASTGVSEKMLIAENIPYKKVYTHPADHAGYYPGASQMYMKLLYSAEDQKILGAQAIGMGGVDKRIDVIAVAIRGGMTVQDLADLELCYAPPYGSAKDAVNLAGMAALNDVRGLSPFMFWEDIKESEFLLDVRTESEFDMGTVSGAINIPLDELRDRLKEIPKGRRIAVFCQVGIRGHIASRILRENGYDSWNVSGGYKTYHNYQDTLRKITSSREEDMSTKESFCTQPTGELDGINSKVLKEIDVRGMQCPGPVVQLKKAMEEIAEGGIIKIVSDDMGFAADIPKWCKATNNVLLKMDVHPERSVAYIARGKALPCDEAGSGPCGAGTTIVVFSGDLDKALAAMIIARGALSSGRRVSMFFTFWGLNILKKRKKPPVAKDLLSRMFGMMMPSSAGKLKLSKLNMCGMGTAMMKYVMRGKNVESVETMLELTIEEGAEITACSMSMDVMGIKKEELIDGVKIGGVAYYIGEASLSGHNLFI